MVSVARNVLVLLVNGTEGSANSLKSKKKVSITHFTGVVNMTKSLTCQKNIEQTSLPLSEPVAVCHSLTQTESTTFVPLDATSQIVLVAIIQAYLSEMIGGDTHWLAMHRGIDIAVKMGVPEAEAIALAEKLLKHRHNPFPGFM